MVTETQVYTVKEPCGREWSDELLSFPLTWALGVQQDTAIGLAGSRGPLPTQLTEIVCHPDGSLASATLWCRVSLHPGETLTLEPAPATVAPDNSLFWNVLPDGGYETGNALFAVRVPAGGIYPLAAAPGPVTAIRIAGEEWLGAGSLHASRPVVVETTLHERGPLFLRWNTRYYYETRTLADVTCTLYAGEDFLHFREHSSRDADLIFQFDCFPGLAPDRLLTKGGGEHMAQVVQTLDYARPEELAVIDFHSGHHQMSLSWLGVYQDGAVPFLGLVELNGSAWTNTSINRLHLDCRPPESLIFRVPLQGGVKEWALVCSTTTRNLKAAESRVCNHLSRLHQRYAELPLRKVLGWTLEWEAEAPTARPLLQCPADGITAARARVAADPELQRVYHAWEDTIAQNTWFTGSCASTLTTLWVAFGDERYAQRAVDVMAEEIRLRMQTIWDEGLYMRLIIFDGRIMKMWLQAYDLLHAGGFIDEDRDRLFRRDLAFLAYAFADPEYFPHQYNLADFHDPDSFYGGLGQRIGDSIDPPNFHTEYYTSFGMMGCCFRTHPQAARWRADAAALLTRQLDVHFTDAGVYMESPNYHAHVFVMLNQLALALRRCGEQDFFAHPRIKAQFDYFCQIQTPPVLQNADAQHYNKPWLMLDPDRTQYAMLPSNGNSGHNCSDQPLPVELAVGAAIYQASDPALAARCMTTWRRGGRRVVNHYDDLTFLLLADPHLPGVESVGTRSSLLTGSYVTFRAHAETEDEVFVLVKNGTATHHNDFDEGGFAIWAYGAPLASDFGYHADHEGRTYGVGDTWKHNCVEFDGKSSGYLGIELTCPPEQWVTTPRADLLVSYLPITNFRDNAQSYMDQVPAQRIEYRRYTLFVKPHYLLIFDSIQDCPYTHRWWLHAQANEVAVDGARVRFRGAFGVDLLAHFITPATPVITSGTWSVMKHIAALQSHARDWRVFVAPAKPGQDFQVTSTHAGRVVQVATPEYQDTVFLAHHPFHYADAGVTFHGKVAVVRRYADGSQEMVRLDCQSLDWRD